MAPGKRTTLLKAKRYPSNSCRLNIQLVASEDLSRAQSVECCDALSTQKKLYSRVGRRNGSSSIRLSLGELEIGSLNPAEVSL